MRMTNRTRQVTAIATMIALALVVAALPFRPASAQTAEQLKQWREMPADQRKALLDALNDGGVVQQQSFSMPDEPREPETDDDTEPENDETGESLQDELDFLVEEEVDDEEDAEETIRLFGYDLFDSAPTTFAPVDDIPVPADYVIGPGDNVELQFFGNENGYYSLVVSREGVLNIPNIGPLPVAGLDFDDLKSTVEQRVADQMIGVRSSMTMGRLRSMRIFILGNVNNPGSYTVSALSTMMNALFAGGGISEIGTLRKVELKRAGEVVRTLDLYDVLLHGDTSGDSRLSPGDVIYVPPIGPTVGIDGEVRRPAIYELDGENTVGDVLRLAEGLSPTAYPKASQIERINGASDRTVIDVDLTDGSGLSTDVYAGDTVHIRSVLDKQEGVVELAGHVYREGAYQWRDGMRLSDLVKSARELKPKADTRYVLIRRESASGLRIETLSADLAVALDEPSSADNVRLEPRDRVIVFSLESDRREEVDPILEDLQLQSSHWEPVREVRINGRVRAPGAYPLDDGMRVSDLIRAGGDLDEAAYMLEAELSRHTNIGGQERRIEFISIDIAALVDGDPAADIPLEPYDVITIKKVPLWRDYETIRVEGEVQFPGSYPIKRGERLSSVIQRAGGLTDLAFAKGAVFLREELRLREEQQLASLAERLEGEIAAQVNNDDISRSSSDQEALLRQLRSTEATGRLVIDLELAMLGGVDNAGDIQVRAGDELLIPRISQTVTVIGEVQHPTSHVLKPDETHKNYISMSGGMTAEADEDRVYVVRANGSVVAPGNGRFRNRKGEPVYPGDTIVVPVEADPVSKLALWTSVSTILYNIGIAAAAVASF